jgi:aminomethyltransferase
MNRTPLYHAHETIGAKLVDFAGWDMPIQYSGVVDEYHAVRTHAGLFDVSHMGRIRVAGKGAAAFLQYVTTNDVSTLNVLESQYSMVCNAEGGIKDDIFVYRLKTDEFLLCVNASNREKIVNWVQEQAARASEVHIADRSRELAQIALQGPAAPVILAGMEVTGLSALKPRCCLEASLLGVPTLITRTGYTGEVGFELYMPSTGAVRIWDELLARGHTDGLKPAGLGARDLLRLDMAYLLYGNDIGEDRTPLEAGAAWVVKLNKGPFIGSDALHRQQKEGLPRCLVAFELLQKAVPRHGFRILAEDGSVRTPIGEVTSGNLSPLLQKGIGLGYVPPSHADVGTRMAIDIRGKVTPAVVVKPPFYKRKAG